MLIDHSAIKDGLNDTDKPFYIHVPVGGMARVFFLFFFVLGGGQAKGKENFCIL